MDVIDRRMLMGRVLAQMAGSIPSVFNHLEGGTIIATEDGAIDIQTNIVFPKGILVWSNDFSCFDPKADKPVLGAYAAMFITPSDIDQAHETNGWTVITDNSFYFVNWGQSTYSKNATARSSRTEPRGIQLFNKSTKIFRIRGFGTGDYDFKLNTTYNWIAWD